MIRKTLGILLAAAVFAGCDTETQSSFDNCISVTFVRALCGYAVLQIQNPSYYAVGETTEDGDHVFLAEVECDANFAELQSTALFYVELNPVNFDNDCPVCMAAIHYSGSKKYKVRIHSQCAGSDE